MAGHTRRDFLKTTGAGALAVGLGAHAQPPAGASGAPAAQGPGAGTTPPSGAGQGRPPTGNLGTVVWRGDPDYEATRRRMVWNQRLPDRFPEVIVTVASDQDVVEAVKLARARGLRIAVRSGGHNWVGSSLRDGGMTVDLSRLTNVTVDPAARVAAAQPAIRNTELVAALGAQGLAFPSGHCPTVAIGGYLLAGGEGWNQGSWGPACQSVLAIDLVNADGELITADAQHYPDLYWMARGVGAGFPGIITRYHLRVYPAPKVLGLSIYVYPLDQLETIVPWLKFTVGSLAPSVEMMSLMSQPPPSVRGQLADPSARYFNLWPVAFGDSQEENAAALAPFESAPGLDRALVRQFNASVSWSDLFAIEAAAFPEPARYDVEVAWSNADPLAVLSDLRTRLARAPSPDTQILAAITPPPTVDPTAREMAYSLAAPLYVTSYCIWKDAADDAVNMAWQRETARALEQFAVGHYIGETDLTASPTRAAESFAPGVWERLQAVRQQYDPQGVFFGHVGQA
jgi:FAD/FMN-containing dehydrogenase